MKYRPYILLVGKIVVIINEKRGVRESQRERERERERDHPLMKKLKSVNEPGRWRGVSE